MKKFKYPLEALIKLRKTKEDLCKQEIGRLQVQIHEYKDRITVHKNDIGDAYSSQEGMLRGGTGGREVQFYPYMFEGKIAHIKKLETEIERIQDEVDEKYTELAQLRADVKVIEKLKEKEFKKYRKYVNKKSQSILEENTQNFKAILGLK